MTQLSSTLISQSLLDSWPVFLKVLVMILHRHCKLKIYNFCYSSSYNHFGNHCSRRIDWEGTTCQNYFDGEKKWLRSRMIVIHSRPSCIKTLSRVVRPLKGKMSIQTNSFKGWTLEIQNFVEFNQSRLALKNNFLIRLIRPLFVHSYF